MDTKGQASMFDMVLALLAFTVSFAVIAGFSNNESAIEKEISREEYTKGVLVSVMYCTIDSSQFRGMTLSDLVAAYFRNQSLNQTVSLELSEHIKAYTEDRGLDWVVYANGTSIFWVPYGKVLSGRKISSAVAYIPISENESEKLYLFIKWD